MRQRQLCPQALPSRSAKMAARLLASTLLASMLCATSTALEPRDFSSTTGHERYLEIIAELRCLVCQNQNIADSNAPLAADLRKQVFEMIEAGKTDADIADYMTARYGDFVLYQPPFTGRTLLLWLGPFALAVAGVWLLRTQVVNRQRAPRVQTSDELQAKARNLLDGKHPPAGE